MTKRIQRGIFYHRKPFDSKPNSLIDDSSSANDSFAILFLRVIQDSTADQVAESIHKLWKMYQFLQKGVVSDLPDHVPSGDLSVLIGYGPNIFRLRGINRKIPRDFKDRQFLPSISGRPILEGSGIRYADDVHENVGQEEYIAIQFISKTQLAAFRAVVETWKFLQNSGTKKEPLRLSRFFTGFQRDDGRSWLGFHDEVSNMKNAKERQRAIVIDVHNNSLSHEDSWTVGGTYMAYLRIEIDLDAWTKISRKHQQLIIGRNKLTGRPLVGVDINGNPVVRDGCPEASQLKGYNKNFHDHPNYLKKPRNQEKTRHNLDIDASLRILSQSHIGRTRHITNVNSKERTSRRIFRQGFEFLEPVYNNQTKIIRAGLNFVSFQNDPGRLFFILTDPNWFGNSNFGGLKEDSQAGSLLSVVAAGIFFIPPIEKPFPGASIFKSSQTSHI